MKKIALYFGSFNPIHIGHLIIAQTVLEKTENEEVWMIVSPQNPFKLKKNLLDHNERLKMIELATKDNEKVNGSDVEFGLPIPSYTIDTLKYLDKNNKDHEYSLVMGEDNLEHLDKWKESEELIDSYSIYVYPRMGHKTDKFRFAPHIYKIKSTIIELSSTTIRNKIAKGKSIKYLTRDAVIDYMQEKRHYVSLEEEEE